MSDNSLKILKARENNLKEVSLEIPHDELTVVTGLSGSGKSSLAFDTVYAEGQRRYIETFSPYTRQFFDKVKKPDVEALNNVRPAVAIQQRTRITSARSTVGTMTNCNDYLKLLFVNAATARCPSCHTELSTYTAEQLASHLLSIREKLAGRTWMLCAGIRVLSTIPTVQKSKKKTTTKTKKAKTTPAVERGMDDSLAELKVRLGEAGYSRFFDARSGALISSEELNPHALYGNVALVALERIKSAPQKAPTKKSLQDTINQAFSFEAMALGTGLKGEATCFIVETFASDYTESFRPFSIVINNVTQTNRRAAGYRVQVYSNRPACPEGITAVPRPRPAMFSYNHPLGACETCRGFGFTLGIDRDLVVPNKNLSLKDKAIHSWSGEASKPEHKELLKFAAANKIPTDVPWKDLSNTQHNLIFTSKTKDYWGVDAWFAWLETKIYKMHVRVFLSRYRKQKICPTCRGTRLKPDASAFELNGKTLPDIWDLPIEDLMHWAEDTQEHLQRERRLTKPLKEIFLALDSRLRYLFDLGLPYLTLNRQAKTLSGGETQRVNLATALGSELVSTQFVLDEPSVGLHARDTARLIKAIRHLSERGNSVLVVEHDLECMNAADNIVEIGPKAGSEGGEVVYSGPSRNWKGIQARPVDESAQRSITTKTPKLVVKNATSRNLKGFNLDIPLERFVVLSGASGSGKSTLVHEVLVKAYASLINGYEQPNNENLVSGFESINDVLVIDQSPLTKSPRSTIASYIGMWDEVRNLLSQTQSAHERALNKSSFSFNVDGGRCPNCKGSGFIREEMQFLSDVFVPCDICLGTRFQPTVLEVTYQGKNVSEILNLTIENSLLFFSSQPKIVPLTRNLILLGLGHLRLGHALSELSGGEAQRLKLIPYITQAESKKSLLIFDEPTTGLHIHDIERLIELFQSLRDRGHSVLCIEHNLTVLRAADWIIDLGLEGGKGGGSLLLTGTPHLFLEPQNKEKSYTALYLQKEKETSKAVKLAPTVHAAPTELIIQGAREHNLKNIDVAIPLRTFVALTGVSGSGKSSIAKDIIFAEGQRRYLDCLSPYARQFIRELRKPEIDEIRNIQPTICVYQHTFQPSKLSTVGTMSESYNFLRLLFAKLGTQHCPDHPQYAIAPMTPSDMAEAVRNLNETSVRVLAPIVKMKKGTHREILERAAASDITQVRVDGVWLSASTVAMSGGLEKSKAHTIEYVLGKFNPKTIDKKLTEEVIAQALTLSGGTVLVVTDSHEHVFSTDRACPICKRGFFKPDPEDLSFHSRRGRCEKCHGSGENAKGGVCGVCKGTRLQAVGRSIYLQGSTIADVANLTAPALHAFLSSLVLITNFQKELAAPIVSELFEKIAVLTAVGLDYISLGRSCNTLSNGELQRLRLSAALGCALSGAMFIFDEPSAGLHPDDNDRVLLAMRRVLDRDNSLIMIEHDRDSILSSDYVIEVGPGGGRDGGNIVYSGPAKLLTQASTPTAVGLRHDPSLEVETSAVISNESLIIKNAVLNNLKSVSVSIPLGQLVVFGGVSGAGKSSLVHGVIRKLIEAKIERQKWVDGGTEVISSIPLTRLIEVDQKPIGINSRSTPASYLKIFDEIRSLYAEIPESRARGWAQSFFSYNSGTGRCPECKGLGEIKMEMSFLPDARVLCERCQGRRYGDDALSVQYLGLRIDEVLKLTFEEAKTIFVNHRKISRVAHLACELGLGYLTLGQSSSTLSGGESQRIKLVSELNTPQRGHTLYILDEPTTGLHRNDVAKLLKTLRELVGRGNSVFVIEHDPDVVASSDFFLELGPGPGTMGGEIIFKGAPRGLKTALTPWAKRFAPKHPLISRSVGNAARW